MNVMTNLVEGLDRESMFFDELQKIMIDHFISRQDRAIVMYQFLIYTLVVEIDLLIDFQSKVSHNEVVEIIEFVNVKHLAS